MKNGSETMKLFNEPLMIVTSVALSSQMALGGIFWFGSRFLPGSFLNAFFTK